MAILYRRALALDKFTRNALSASIHARESRHARDFFSNTPGKQLLKGREVIKLCEEEDMFLYDRLQTHEDYKPAVCDVCRKVSKLQDVLTYYGSCGVVKQ
ncbi:hypothetical protein IRJ41_021908 [Triplophysa rosa]|uniref:Uncharacterized protein n=1 Tax=Triplophysa rosa TaxID=992332 RepID=A0A9W7WBN1_TRIRA|nr:hypothetical protein IRJ41_021908 [Triplophysa rosa]